MFKKGSRIQFKLQRPYTEEEIKMGYDNSVNGIFGTIIYMFDCQVAEVRLDKPLQYQGKSCFVYTDTIGNMILI